MSNSRKKIEKGQTAFDFEAQVESYVAAKAEVLEACAGPRPVLGMEDAGELCVEIAAAVKRALRETGLSREQLVDRINNLLGLSRGGAERPPLSIHMLNHYLSKPVEYPLPAFVLPAIASITGSVEPIRPLVEPLGARVISEADVRLMTLGKLEATINEMQRLKREIKGMT